jgi:hypothetical protein
MAEGDRIEQFPVLVVGGGGAGLTASMLLRRACNIESVRPRGWSSPIVGLGHKLATI